MTSISCCLKKADVLCGAWHCPGYAQTQSFVQKHPSLREPYNHGKAWCSIGSWGFHPTSQVHLTNPMVDGTTYHDWRATVTYRPWVGCTHLPVSAFACGAREHGHHCETTWSKIPCWRHSAPSALDPSSVYPPPPPPPIFTHMAAFPVSQSQSWIPRGMPKPISSSQ